MTDQPDRPTLPGTCPPYTTALTYSEATLISHALLQVAQSAPDKEERLKAWELRERITALFQPPLLPTGEPVDNRPDATARRNPLGS